MGDKLERATRRTKCRACAARWWLLAAGGHHTCIAPRGELPRCFGSASWGQLGHGATHPPQTTPTVVATGEPLIAIAAGDWHSCGLRESGRVYCWGSGLGPLGDARIDEDDPIEYTLPVVVPDLGRVVEIAAGGHYACARDDRGRVSCWGSSVEMDLAREGPRSVGLSEPAVRLAPGSQHMCVVGRSGAVHCWG